MEFVPPHEGFSNISLYDFASLFNHSGLLYNVSGDNFTADASYNFILPWWRKLIWSLLFWVMVTVATGGNLIVIWIVLAHKRMRTVTNYFLVNLSIADTMVSTLNVTFNYWYMMNADWPFGALYCKISQFVSVLSISASVFTLMAISIDRTIPIKSKFSEDINETDSRDDSNSSLKAKKKRLPNRDWIKFKEFNSAKDAEENLASQSIWSKLSQRNTLDGRRVDYRCSAGKYRSKECPAGLQLLYHLNSNKVTMFLTEYAHDNHRTDKFRGLDHEIKAFVKEKFEEGFQKSKDIYALIRHYKLKEPSRSKLRYYIQRLRFEKYGVTSVFEKNIDNRDHNTESDDQKTTDPLYLYNDIGLTNVDIKTEPSNDIQENSTGNYEWIDTETKSPINIKEEMTELHMSYDEYSSDDNNTLMDHIIKKEPSVTFSSESNFEDDLSETDSDEDSNVSKMRKKRQSNRVWIKIGEFSSAKDAQDNVASQKTWSKSSLKNISEGRRVDYRCSAGKYRSNECPAGLYLLYHSDSDKVSMFSTDCAHDNHYLEQTRGLDYDTKLFIQNIFENGIRKPNAILAHMRRHNMKEPPKSKLISFIKRLRGNHSESVEQNTSDHHYVHENNNSTDVNVNVDHSISIEIKEEQTELHTSYDEYLCTEGNMSIESHIKKESPVKSLPESQFIKECTETESYDDNNSALKRRKKRQPNRVWKKIKEFSSAKDAEKNVESQMLWSRSSLKNALDGRRVDYRCSEGKYRTDECPVGMYLFYHSDSDKVSMFLTENSNHNHPMEHSLDLNHVNDKCDENVQNLETISTDIKHHNVEKPSMPKLIPYIKNLCDHRSGSLVQNTTNEQYLHNNGDSTDINMEIEPSTLIDHCSGSFEQNTTNEQYLCNNGDSTEISMRIEPSTLFDGRQELLGLKIVNKQLLLDKNNLLHQLSLEKQISANFEKELASLKKAYEQLRHEKNELTKRLTSEKQISNNIGHV